MRWSCSLLITKLSEMAQLALKILRGNLAASIMVNALSFALDQFKYAYDCHGPVMLDVLPYNRTYLQTLSVGQRYCYPRKYYNYTTQGGCRDDQPFDLRPKISSYVGETCIQRFQGSNDGGGEVIVDKPASAGKRFGPPGHLVGLGAGAMLMLIWLNAL